MPFMQCLRLCFLTGYWLAVVLTAAAQTPGSLDLSFADDGRLVERFDDLSPTNQLSTAVAIALAPNGDIVVLGFANGNSLAPGQPTLARYLPNGSPDSSFALDGFATLSEAYVALTDVVQAPDGSWLVLGDVDHGGMTGRDVVLTRVLPNGTEDQGFGPVSLNGSGGADQARDLLLTAGEDVLILAEDQGQSPSAYLMAQVDLSGQPDSSFGANGRASGTFSGLASVPHQLLETDDGDLLMGLTLSDSSTMQARFEVRRFDSSGSPDPSFGTSGRILLAPNFETRDFVLAQQADGRLVIGGESNRGITGEEGKIELWRYLPDGQLDSSFQQQLVNLRPGNERVVALAIQPDGAILAGCETDTADWFILRYSSTGAPDTTFAQGGLLRLDQMGGRETLAALTMQADGKLLVLGNTRPEFTLGGAPTRYWLLARVETGLTSGVEPERKAAWQLWPNPSRGRQVTLRGPALAGPHFYRLLDAQGRVWAKGQWMPPVSVLRLPQAMPAGLYWLELRGTSEHWGVPLLLLRP